MKIFFRTLLLTVAGATLLCGNIYAQTEVAKPAVEQESENSLSEKERKAIDKENRKKAREELRESMRNGGTTTQRRGPITITENPDTNFTIPEGAEFLDGSRQQMYYLRNVNIHGVKYLNHDILRSASGLVRYISPARSFRTLPTVFGHSATSPTSRLEQQSMATA